MENNRHILMNSTPMIEISKFSLLLKIQYLSIEKVIEALSLLCEDQNLQTFTDTESIIMMINTKISEINRSLDIVEESKLKFKIDKRTEEEKERAKERFMANKIKKLAMTDEEKEQERIKMHEDEQIRLIKIEEHKNRALEYESNDSEDKLYSILVLCADDPSFLNSKFKKILRVMGNLKQPIEEYKIYYIGLKLTEVLPFRLNGGIDRISELGMFDIIINEHCPNFVFKSGMQSEIFNHLKSGGNFITPNYRHFNFDSECYIEDVKSNRDYIVYNKE